MSIWKAILGISVIGGTMAGCASTPAEASQVPTKPVSIPKNAQTLVVAGGCFWCVEVLLEELKGVYFVESGYAGGPEPNPTYEEVCSGMTGHAEVVKVFFNPNEISAEDILRVFFTTHDPTTLNRQGNDKGTQYRSAVFYSNPEEKASAEKIRAEMGKVWKDPIVTTIEPLINYSRAEEYHQDYYAKYEKATPAQREKMNGGYCAAIIEPKVRKFREKYFAKLKKVH